MTSATAKVETHEADQAEEATQSGPSYDDINTPVILMVGAISAILTICTIFFVQGVFYQWKNGYVRERSYDYVNEPVREIVESQKAMLDGDSEKGIKPMTETMDEVIKQYGKK